MFSRCKYCNQTITFANKSDRISNNTTDYSIVMVLYMFVIIMKYSYLCFWQ
jgi:hypothetical protein